MQPRSEHNRARNGQIAKRSGLHQQMVVIGHQDVAVIPESKVLSRTTQQLSKLLPVGLVAKNCLALVASGSHVIVRAPIFDP